MDSSPQERIEVDVRRALKSGEKERLSTLRMLLNAIKNERIRSGEEVDEATFFGLVRKAIKQRQDASEQFSRGGREELADRERREAEILGAYLPAEVDESELETAIRDYVHSQGLSGPQAIGPVMKEMLAKFSGRADGATIQRLARAVLADTVSEGDS